MKNIFIKFIVFPIITVILIFSILFIQYLIDPNAGDMLTNILLGIPMIGLLLLIPVNIYFIIKRKEYIWLIIILILPIVGSISYYFFKYKNHNN